MTHYKTENIKLFPEVFIPLDEKCSEDDRREMVRQLIEEKIFKGDNVVRIEKLSGGVTNILYKVTTDKRLKKLLCRVNGIGSELLIDREQEITYMVEIMHRLSDSTVHARYGNGIVYDFIEGVPIGAKNLAEHAEGIASQLARFHKLELEGDPNPILFKLLDNWVEKVKDTFFEEREKQELYEKIKFHERILPEIEMMRNVLKGWDIRFCHNDLLGLNIIYNEEESKYSFIDYEYCGYNYVAFEIGDHFFEYLGVAEYDPNAYPSVEVQTTFVRTYLKNYHGREPTDREVEILRRQSNIGGLCTNLYWGTWGIFQAKHSSIDFDFLDYSYQRFEAYFRMKEQLFQDPNDV